MGDFNLNVEELTELKRYLNMHEKHTEADYYTRKQERRISIIDYILTQTLDGEVTSRASI